MPNDENGKVENQTPHLGSETAYHARYVGDESVMFKQAVWARGQLSVQPFGRLPIGRFLFNVLASN